MAIFSGCFNSSLLSVDAAPVVPPIPPASFSLQGLQQRINNVRSMMLIEGGSSGVYKCLDANNRAIGIFKPCDEGYGPNNPKLWTRLVRWIQYIFLSWFFTCHRESLIGHSEAQAEVWASGVDRYLGLHLPGFHIVPKTQYVHFDCALLNCEFDANGRKIKGGSFQEWVDGLTPASTHAPSFRGLWYWSWANEVPFSLTEFEKIALLTFLIGGQDYDTDNYGWAETAADALPLDQEARPHQAILNDNGLSFPHHHPNDWISTRKLAMWGKLQNAQQPFSESMQGHIATWDQPWLNGLFAELAHTGTPLTPGQKRTMAERLEVLKDYAATNRTLADLAEMKRLTHFDAFFNASPERSALREAILREYSDLEIRNS